MVGAGMSRNAVALRPDLPPMPLWRDLAEAMAADVWPNNPYAKNTDPLMLPEYYERLHNRTALDTFLQRHIHPTDGIALGRRFYHQLRHAT
jgi:hypothetical protein